MGGAQASPTDHPRRGESGCARPRGVPRPRSPGSRAIGPKRHVRSEPAGRRAAAHRALGAALCRSPQAAVRWQAALVPLVSPSSWGKTSLPAEWPAGKMELDDQTERRRADDPGARPRCSLACLPTRVGRHVNATAGRALVTISADHPCWGDGWVVCRTAWCGSVDDTNNRIRAAAAPAGAAGATGGGTCRVRSRCRASGGGQLRACRPRIAGRVTCCPWPSRLPGRCLGQLSGEELCHVRQDGCARDLDSEASADAAVIALKDSGLVPGDAIGVLAPAGDAPGDSAELAGPGGVPEIHAASDEALQHARVGALSSWPASLPRGQEAGRGHTEPDGGQGPGFSSSYRTSRAVHSPCGARHGR